MVGQPDWPEFWKQQRLGYQFQLASSNHVADRQFLKLAEKVLRRMDDLLAIQERPCLIHGDLWSGNFMEGPSGEPVIIDPAVYFAHREAEFGMTTLFGGFGDSFYDAYQEFWPLSHGFEERFEIYRLYHLLNHLNLFGGFLSGVLPGNHEEICLSHCKFLVGFENSNCSSIRLSNLRNLDL